MKRALISPMEPSIDREGNVGFRVAHVADESYDVAAPLFWVDCPDECVQDFWVYIDGNLVDITPVPVEDPIDPPTEPPPPVIDTIIEL